MLQELGTTWATLCNKQEECFDGTDEIGCNFPNLLLPCLLCGMILFLCSTCYFYLQWHIKRMRNLILQGRTWRLVTENSTNEVILRSEKLMNIALLIEDGNTDEVNKIFNAEVEKHASEGRALCCLKVRFIM